MRPEEPQLQTFSKKRVGFLIAGVLVPLVAWAALETGTYISDLVASNPTGADAFATTDDHLRLVKTTIKNTLPNLNSAVNSTDEELNLLVGRTGTIWTSTNDGATSTLDADLLDGISSAAFAEIAQARTVTGLWNFTTAPTISSNIIWHVGNDGIASGLDSDLLDGQSSAFYQNATNLNAGIIPDARIASTGVTQYQTSLTIAETQITDGVILARLNAVSDFTTAPTINSTAISLAGHTHDRSQLTETVLTPAALSASQNDYAPTDHGTATIFRLDANGNTPAIITGLAGGSANRRVLLVRLATTGTIRLDNESASSLAANRFTIQGGSYTLNTGVQSIELWYDGTTSRWVVLS